MEMETINWSLANKKALRHPKNKEFVTARVNIINKQKVIRISIGLDVCDLINFRKNNRVHVHINKNDRNLLLIKRDDFIQDGYLLNFNNNKSSFMTFSFRYETEESFMLSQTIILDYEIVDDGLLLINLIKIKWKK